MADRSQTEIASELIRVLDGLPIDKARQALLYACDLLLSTQVVHADSMILRVKGENASALGTD